MYHVQTLYFSLHPTRVMRIIHTAALPSYANHSHHCSAPTLLQLGKELGIVIELVSHQIARHRWPHGQQTAVLQGTLASCGSAGGSAAGFPQICHQENLPAQHPGGTEICPFPNHSVH